VIHTPGSLRYISLLTVAGAKACDGHAGRKTLVPLHEPHVRHLVFQGVQSIQNLASLKADIPTQGPGNTDHDLRDALFANQPPKKAREVRARYDLERTGDYPLGIGDGNAGAYFPQVEGSDPPARVFRIRQDSATSGR
jgi:hypothetical protein